MSTEYDTSPSPTDQISVKEAAELLGYSRVHIVRLINKGEISAKRIGRSYVVDKRSLGTIFKKITNKDEKYIKIATNKAIKEFEVALRKLGRE